MAKSKLSELLEKRDTEIASQWLELQSAGGRKVSAAEQGEITRQSREFIQALKKVFGASGAYERSG